MTCDADSRVTVAPVHRQEQIGQLLAVQPRPAREFPLQGKFVLEVTIAPLGQDHDQADRILPGLNDAA
jgi:hypothetical protein